MQTNKCPEARAGEPSPPPALGGGGGVRKWREELQGREGREGCLKDAEAFGEGCSRLFALQAGS